MSSHNVCMRCGACCAFYRVAFDRGEVDDVPGGVIPFELTLALSSSRSVMKGTEKQPMRCSALEGQIGCAVQCAIYDRRPTTCRNFMSIWEHNVLNELCDRARSAYGLIPLSCY